MLEKSELEYAYLYVYGNTKEKMKSMHGVCTTKGGEEKWQTVMGMKMSKDANLSTRTLFFCAVHYQISFHFLLRSKMGK